jgi:hypothetical protein
VAATLSSAEEWLRPLDRARTALFVRALEVAPLRAVLVEKRRRVPALLLLHASAAFVLSVFAPTLLLVVGPLLLGVPHLVADLRYLVLRPRLSTLARAGLLGGALLAAWLAPSGLRLVMAHAHNVIAIGIWALMFCKARGRALAVSAVLAVATLVLLASPLAWFGFEHGLVQSFGLHALTAADTLAPFAHSAPLALGVVASFAFLQSIHYAVWLHAIPQEATRGEGTLSFRMSFRALRSELGTWGLALAALLVVAVPLSGLVAPLRTQSIYLQLATFHGYLELGALALWWLGRKASS